MTEKVMLTIAKYIRLVHLLQRLGALDLVVVRIPEKCKLNCMNTPHQSEDIERLHRLGYPQELKRILGGFSNYALSLSIICIVAGGITSFHVGYAAVGGAAIGIVWPVWTVISLCVALAMGQVASAFPTAGGLYHWAAILGGRFWGFFVAWLNLAGLVTVLAAINVGSVRFAESLLDFNLDHPWIQALLVAAITFSQALINHKGISLTRILIDFSGWWILGVSAAIIISVLMAAPSLDIARAFTWTNLSGTPEGDGSVWPASDSIVWLAFMSALLPAYTITGFDASAHAAEETIDAAREVPLGMVRSVVVSGIVGWVMLGVVVISIQDPLVVAESGENAFMTALRHAVGSGMAMALGLSACVGQYLCGLATVTAASRMTYAFARDGGLPYSVTLARVSPGTRAPVAAIWAVSVTSVLFTVWTPVYATIASVCTMLLYLSYVVPLVLAARALGRTWTEMGPFQLGRWFIPASMVSVIGCAGLVVIGVQPPTDQALIVLVAFGAGLMVFWFCLARFSFTGPPAGMLTSARLKTILTIEKMEKAADAGGVSP